MKILLLLLLLLYSRRWQARLPTGIPPG